MKLNRQLLPLNKPEDYSEDIDFSSYNFDPNYIRGIPECHVDLVATQYESTLRVAVKVKAKVIGVCAYTLEDVEVSVNVNDELNFTDDESDEACYYAPDTIIDLDDFILALILAALPVKIVKKGAKLPGNGDGYRVLTEDEFLKEREKQTDSRWAALNDIELDTDK